MFTLLSKRTPPFALALCLFLSGLCLFAACADQSSPPHSKRTQFIMGTLVEITVRHTDRELSQRAISAAFAEIRRIENMMSVYIPDSEISRVNRAAGSGFTPVSPETAEVLLMSLRVKDISSGAFDVTIGPLAKLWNFDGDSHTPPETQAIANALALRGEMRLQGQSVSLEKPGMEINLGAIAKGYAVDRALKTLRDHGVGNAIVNAGGDLAAMGRREDNRSWQIGIQHPRQPAEILAAFAVDDFAVATSGDYQRYFIKDNIRYHHIFDPATGLPAPDSAAVTVTAKTAMEADALATAAFVLGYERGIALLESLPGVSGFAVRQNGERHYAKSFRALPEFKEIQAKQSSFRNAAL